MAQARIKGEPRPNSIVVFFMKTTDDGEQATAMSPDLPLRDSSTSRQHHFAPNLTKNTPTMSDAAVGHPSSEKKGRRSWKVEHGTPHLSNFPHLF